MNVYINNVAYRSKQDTCLTALKVYDLLESRKKEIPPSRKGILNVLAYYAIYGYNKPTKKLVRDSLGIKAKNLDQINSELTRKGYLVKDEYNYTNKHLSIEIEKISNYCKDGGKMIVLNFKDE